MSIVPGRQAPGYAPQSENRRTKVLSSTTQFDDLTNGRLLGSD